MRDGIIASGCGWCGRRIEFLVDGGLPKDTYALELSDGDEYFFCCAGHVIWWISEYEIEDEGDISCH